MKQITFGISGVLLIVVILMTTLSIEGASSKERKLKQAFRYAMAEAMESALKKDSFSAEDDDLLVADVMALLIERLDVDENATLQVDVAAVDSKKGLLSLHVTEEFVNASGEMERIEDEATILLEREQQKSQYQISYLLPEKVAEELLYPQVIRAYRLEEGCLCKVPQTPSILEGTGRGITGWMDTETNTTYTAEQLRSLPVSHDMTLEAVIKE